MTPRTDSLSGPPGGHCVLDLGCLRQETEPRATLLRRLGTAGPPRLRPPSLDAAWTLVCWLRMGQAQHQQPASQRGRSAQGTPLRPQPGLGPPGRSPEATVGWVGEVLPQNFPWLLACGGGGLRGPQLGRTWSGWSAPWHAGTEPGGGLNKTAGIWGCSSHCLGLVMVFEVPERKDLGASARGPPPTVPREGAVSMLSELGSASILAAGQEDTDTRGKRNLPPPPHPHPLYLPGRLCHWITSCAW